MRCLKTVILILFLVKTGFAQNNGKELTDPLSQQMHWYKIQKAAPSLFVHFDKNIYTNNETAWFTAYLTNTNISVMEKHNVLSVALVRNADSSIVKQQKFLMAKGLSFGDMVLPDSMQAGDYHFMATTNRVSKGIPDVAFIQQITIKTNLQPAFNASIKLLEAGIAGQKPSQVVLAVTSKDARFLPRPVEVLYTYGKISKKAKTNASGELLLSLDEQVNLTDPNLYLKLKYGKDSSYINMNMPVSRRKATVRFYPEGGSMVAGLPVRVGWEAKDQQGAALNVKAVLFKNQEIVDTLESNKYGIGKFMLNPEKEKTYSVKLIHSGFTDSAYILPPAQDQGLTLFMRQAALKDTMILVLKTSLPDQRVFVRVHNFRETFLYAALQIHGQHNAFKIPLDDIPTGLNTVTVSDTLGKPYAERLFFAHYNPARKVNITTEQNTYNQRQKVNLKLQLNQDSIAIVSISCVQANRLADKQSTDIESYNYLGRELSQIPVTEGRGLENPDFIEDLLLVKGWSRYSWPDLLKTSTPDTNKIYEDTNLSIQVEKTKKPVQLGLLQDKRVVFLTTMPNGLYQFKLEDLVVESGKKIHLLNTTKGGFAIHRNDPYEGFNKSFLKTIPLDYKTVPSTVQNNRVLSLKDNESAIRLKEVQITNKKEGFYGRGPSGSNACGDYVCTYNILNCPNHTNDFGNTQPIPGHSYRSMGGMVTYQTCQISEENQKMIPINGIYTKREFYMNDYSDLQEPAFASTLYWNPVLFLDTKEQVVSFYTGDIIGKFRIIVQGISKKNLLYGDYTFEVKALDH